MTAQKAKRRKPGRPRKYGQGRINATVRFVPERYAELKKAADDHGRSVSEEVEARVEQLAHWGEIFRNESVMVARLGEQTDGAIEAVMHKRKWGKIIDPRYGGPVFIRPGQHALPSSGFFDPKAEAREKEEAQHKQQQHFEEATGRIVEAAVARALAKARLTINGEGK